MAVIVPITADFDPAGIKSADAAFRSFGQNLSRVLSQASKTAASSLASVEDGANDARTAAQRLAAAVDKTAAGLEADIEKSAAAARALSAALGPEMAERIGRNGLQNLIRQFTRMGLTLDEVTAEAETLAVAVRRIDNLSVDNLNGELGKLDTNVSKVADGADRSRSVFANFAGNAAQEIPGITSAMGPLNTAVGQFVEYATEGNISLLGLAKAVGPIAAVSAGIALLVDNLQNAAETKAFNAEQVNAFRDAILEGANAATAFQDSIREVGKLETRVFDPDARFGLSGLTAKLGETLDIVGAFINLPGIGSTIARIFGKEKTEDLTDELNRLGLNLQSVNRLVQGGRPVILAWADSLKSAGASSKDVDLVVQGLLQSSTNLQKAQLAAAATTQFLGGSLVDYSGSAANATAVQTELADEAARAAEEYQAQADAIAAARNQLFRFIDIGRTTKELDQSTAEARNELAKARKRGNAKDIAQAEEKYLQAVQREAEYTAEASVQTSKITDEKIKQVIATEKVIASLEAEAQKLGPNSPLIRNFNEWVRKLREELPKNLTTDILVRYSGVVSTTGTQGLGGSFVPPAPSPFGAGGINISVQSLDPQTSAKLVSQTMNQAADSLGQPRPFPWIN